MYIQHDTVAVYVLGLVVYRNGAVSFTNNEMKSGSLNTF